MISERFTGPALPKLRAMAEGLKRHLKQYWGRHCGWQAMAVITAVTLVPQAGTIGDASAQQAGLTGSYLAGRHAQNQRDISAAAKYLGQALERDPANENLIRRAFVLLLADGKVDEAIPHARTILSFQPKEPIANAALAVHAIKTGDLQAANEGLAKLPDDGINRYIAPVLRAWALAGLGQLDQALALVAVEPGAPAQTAPLFTLHQGLLKTASGRADAGLADFQAVLDGPAGLSLRLAEFIGGIHHRAGRLDEARAIYQTYKDQRPRSRLLDPAIAALGGQPPEVDVAKPVDGAAEALYDVASSLRRQNARETALVLAQLAYYLRPDHGGIQVLLADILELDNRLVAANAIYAKVDRQSPFWWETQLRFALNLNQLDETDQAITILNGLAEADPDWIDPIINLGDILRRAERFEEAIVAYDKAEERIGELEARHWPLLYARGIALERSDQWPQAEQNFLRALAFNPDQPYVLNYLGYTWVDKSKNLEEAQDMIRKAVNLRPNDGFIVDSLGWAYYRLGNYDQAVVELERAVELRPQDPVINDHLGDALWKVGRTFEARFQWTRALSFDPDDDLVEKINEKLAQGLKPIKP